MHEVRLVKLAQEKSVVMLTDDFDMTISVDFQHSVDIQADLYVRYSHT